MRYNVLYLIAFFVIISGCGTTPWRPVSRPVAIDRSAPAPPSADRQRSEALLQALLTLDIDYRYGGRSPEQGFDCSGLVAHVFGQAYGLRLPHSAQAQSELGIPVRMDDLQPGDLVFYDTLGRPYSHVGIYLGDDRFVHAPRAGARVRVENLQNSYWTRRFSGARRLAPI